MHWAYLVAMMEMLQTVKIRLKIDENQLKNASVDYHMLLDVEMQTVQNNHAQSKIFYGLL